MNKDLLVIDDEVDIIDEIKHRAEKFGFENVWTAKTVQSGFKLWSEKSSSIAAVVLDINIDKDGDGWTLLETFKKTRSLEEFEVLVFSGHLKKIKIELEAVRTQTISLYQKNWDEDRLWAKLESLAKRFSKPISPGFHFTEEEKAEMDVVADACFPILIVGAPGSGKTIKARELAIRAGCDKERIVLINCASLSNELADSELFGHIKGSFTNAVEPKLGKMLIASGFTSISTAATKTESPKGFAAYQSPKEKWGAVILDEIGALDLAVQAKLLLVIEGEPMQPVGWDGAGFLPNFRVIAVTNEIDKLKKKELFRRDLFKRLSTYILKCRELGDESDDKIRKIIKDISIPFRKQGKMAEAITPSLSEEAIKHILLKKKQIKGGFRELRAIIERALLISKKTKQDFLIDIEDVKEAWKFTEELYSQFENDTQKEGSFEDDALQREMLEQSAAELRSEIAEVLNIKLDELSWESFRKAILSNKEELKIKIRNLIFTDNSSEEKEKGYALLGHALNIKIKNVNPNDIEKYSFKIRERFNTLVKNSSKSSELSAD
jgi:two-component system, NtrC family, response regulator AlgB